MRSGRFLMSADAICAWAKEAVLKLDRTIIKSLPLFDRMTDDELDRLLVPAQSRRVPIGEAVFEQGEPAQNFFLHESPFYDCFECADGRFVSLGALEPQFYAELLQRLGLHDVDPAAQHDRRQWPALRERVAARLREKTRDEWAAQLEGSNACFAPVLTLAEAPHHPHAIARRAYQPTARGHWQPAAAPRFGAAADGARGIDPIGDDGAARPA